MQRYRYWRLSRVGWAAAVVALACTYGLNGQDWYWRQVLSNCPPTVPYYTRAFWTGWEVLVWAAQSQADDGGYTAVGWRWNPRSGTARTLSLQGAPSWPDGQSVLWTGRHLAVWGGRQSADPTSDTNKGYLYDPVADRWLPMTTVDAPSRRAEHGAVWTGSRMFVWGGSHLRRAGTGYEKVFPADFGAYDPTTDTWQRFAATDVPTGRERPGLVWTGKEVLLWGGTRLSGSWDDLHYVYFNALDRFDLATERWTRSLAAGAPQGRADCASAWTGTEWMIWGGYTGRTYGNRKLLSDGARYSPDRDAWTTMSVEHPLGARERPVAVWTGKEILVWCGERQPSVGARYDPSMDTWSGLPDEHAPAFAETGNAAWNGESLLTVSRGLFALQQDSPYQGDLLPNDWQEHYFGVDNPMASPDCDADRDGWLNWHEFLHRTHPLDQRSHPSFRIVPKPDSLAISLPETDPFLVFTFQVAGDLSNWGAPFSSTPQRKDGLLLWEIQRPSGPVEFLQIRVADPHLEDHPDWLAE